MLYIAVLVLTFVFFTFLGYMVHRMFHQSWSGIFYRAHSSHHLKEYPKHDLVSDVYRDSGVSNTFYYFLAIFSPLIVGNVVLTVIGAMPLLLGIGIFIEMGVVSWINGDLHDSFHTTSSKWHRFWFFSRLKRLHDLHHDLNVGTNYGIFSFTWDKLFGTFRKE